MSQREANYTHVVSFRLTDEQAYDADRLRSTFENQTWAEMGRWIFSDPRILSIVHDKIQTDEEEIEWLFEPA